MAWLKQRRRVGVVGMYSSGKTVFLTSLINHLQRHDPKSLPLGNGLVTLKHAYNHMPNNGLQEFPYIACRQQLHGRKWPSKTREVSTYGMSLQMRKANAGMMERVLGENTAVDLSFIDIPGERLADMSMAGKSYEQWSDDLLQFMDDTREYQEPAYDYLELMHCRNPQHKPDETEVVDLYKLTLGKLVHRFLPVISPSSFLVGANRDLKLVKDEQGRVSPYSPPSLAEASGSYPHSTLFPPTSPAELAKNRVVGLAADQQFVPLSAAVRQAHPELAASFRKRYDAYAVHVAAPLAKHFSQCDVLVILMDITMLLMSGVGMYNGNRQMIRLLLSYVDPGHTGRQRLADMFMKFLTAGRVNLGRISKLAFVASKADRVHENDRSKLDALLRDMSGALVDPFVRGKHIDVSYFVCSAVESSKSHEYPRIEGRFLDATGRFGRTPVTVATTPVPSRWPDSWQPGDFLYPENAPDTPDNEQAPPFQIGMDRLVSYILDL